MPNKIIHRIEQLIKHYDLSLSGFDQRLGLGKNYIGKMIRANGNVGSDILPKIVCEFPDVNLNWLITGEGEMLTTEALNFVNEPGKDYYKENIDRFQELMLIYLERPAIKEKIKKIVDEKG
tara:strand:+ start:7919 stop:8281 length:363 start_codon:yes stop_codon:yes gene_type:complete